MAPHLGTSSSGRRRPPPQHLQLRPSLLSISALAPPGGAAPSHRARAGPPTAVAELQCRLMAPTAAWRLVDPGSVPNGIAQGRATAGGATHEGLAGITATRDTVQFRPGVEFNFCFQSRGATLVLDTGCSEIPNNHGVRPIKLRAEVLSTHNQLVLFRICGSPTGIFVYSFPCVGNAKAKVMELPKVSPDIWSSSSFGILRHKSNSDEYVVATLEIGREEAFLNRWWHSPSSWSSASGRRESVTLPPGVKKGNWKTGKVIPCSDFAFKKSRFSKSVKVDALLFVDYKQGILVCYNILNSKEESAAKFHFIPLPGVRRMDKRWQEMFMGVGCCNDILKFVSLYISGVNEVDVTIMTFDGWSWHQTSSFILEFPKGYILCFPVVSANEDNILYLVMANEDRKTAWLYEFDTAALSERGVEEYPGFWKHLKPPYSINFF